MYPVTRNYIPSVYASIRHEDQLMHSITVHNATAQLYLGCVSDVRLNRKVVYKESHGLTLNTCDGPCPQKDFTNYVFWILNIRLECLKNARLIVQSRTLSSIQSYKVWHLWRVTCLYKLEVTFILVNKLTTIKQKGIFINKTELKYIFRIYRARKGHERKKKSIKNPIL